jgi:hypothetical protein
MLCTTHEFRMTLIDDIVAEGGEVEIRLRPRLNMFLQPRWATMCVLFAFAALVDAAQLFCILRIADPTLNAMQYYALNTLTLRSTLPHATKQRICSITASPFVCAPSAAPAPSLNTDGAHRRQLTKWSAASITRTHFPS